jgi:DNA-binding response OmpR family regulator
VHIYRLRDKLGKRFGMCDVVCTVHGHGYKFIRQ